MEPPSTSSLTHLRSTALAFHWTVHAAMTAAGVLLILSLYGAMLGIPLATLGYVLAGVAHSATRHRWSAVPRAYGLGVAAELALAGAGLVAVERISGLAAPAIRAAWTAGALAWVGHLWWGVVIARTQPATPPPPVEADAIVDRRSQQAHSHDPAFP